MSGNFSGRVNMWGMLVGGMAWGLVYKMVLGGKLVLGGKVQVCTRVLGGTLGSELLLRR